MLGSSAGGEKCGSLLDMTMQKVCSKNLSRGLANIKCLESSVSYLIPTHSRNLELVLLAQEAHFLLLSAGNQAVFLSFFC